MRDERLRTIIGQESTHNETVAVNSTERIKGRCSFVREEVQAGFSITAHFSHCGYSPSDRDLEHEPRSIGATDQPNWKGSAGSDPPITPFSVVQCIISSAEI